MEELPAKFSFAQTKITAAFFTLLTGIHTEEIMQDIKPMTVHLGNLTINYQYTLRLLIQQSIHENPS